MQQEALATAVVPLEGHVVDPDEPHRHRLIVAETVRSTSAIGATISAVSDMTAPVDQQLEEIGAQLSWVRDYL